MENFPAEHSGVNPNYEIDISNAKEIIFGYISTLKLTEKQLHGLEPELVKWKTRAELAKSKGYPELALEAEKEIEQIKNKQQRLVIEISELKSKIEEMLRKLPILALNERSIDPDLLIQELLITAGYLPGEEKEACNNRLFYEMEKEVAAEVALSELKAKMKK